jgi:Leucine-rich repeat (LRR) protein
MKTFSIIIAALFLFVTKQSIGQQTNEINSTTKYFSLKKALQKPEKVYWLSLTKELDENTLKQLSKFQNLEYLSLRNAHLKRFPEEVTFLKSLKTLDLSGNDFQFIPTQLTKLTHLEEVYFDKDYNLDLNQAFDVLGKMSSLKALHLDGLKNPQIPLNLSSLKHLELLTLRNDHLIKMPLSISSLKELQVLDLSGNDFETIPKSFSNLESVSEIYLENETLLDFKQAFTILGNLPKLKSLHLDNKSSHLLPSKINQFTSLENLYINDYLFSGKLIKQDFSQYVDAMDLNGIATQHRDAKLPANADIKIEF